MVMMQLGWWISTSFFFQLLGEWYREVILDIILHVRGDCSNKVYIGKLTVLM
jgi:hypothetical protein